MIKENYGESLLDGIPHQKLAEAEKKVTLDNDDEVICLDEASDASDEAEK